MSFVIKIYMTLLYLNEYNVNMNKREYTQANKDWLTAKAQEDGVRSLKASITRYWQRARLTESTPRPEASSLHITQDVPSTANSLTAAVAVRHWQFVCVTLSRDGSSLCSKCVWATNGRSISLLKWVMASSHSQASQEAQLSSLR